MNPFLIILYNNLKHPKIFYLKKVFDLEIDNIFKKVVNNFRGGFCYELNSLFNDLLCNIGFESRIIEARIYDELGNLGPRYDHMAIFVKTDKNYLLDVGFGNLFTNIGKRVYMNILEIIPNHILLQKHL